MTATTTDPPNWCMADRTSFAAGSCSPADDQFRTKLVIPLRRDGHLGGGEGVGGRLPGGTARMGSPSMKRTTPSIIRMKPLPPASTTPASLRTARSSGVLARAIAPRPASVGMNSEMSGESAAARSARPRPPGHREDGALPRLIQGAVERVGPAPHSGGDLRGTVCGAVADGFRKPEEEIRQHHSASCRGPRGPPPGPWCGQSPPATRRPARGRRRRRRGGSG